MRAIWHVSREEAADGVLFGANAISCTLDATTGEFIAVDYTLGSEEIAAMQATADFYGLLYPEGRPRRCGQLWLLG